MKANYKQQYRCNDETTRKAFQCTEVFLYAAGIAMYELLGYKGRAIYNTLKATNSEIQHAYSFTDGYAYRLYLERCAEQKGFDICKRPSRFYWMRGGAKNVLELLQCALVEALKRRRVSNKNVIRIFDRLENEVGDIREITEVTRARLKRELENRTDRILVIKEDKR